MSPTEQTKHSCDQSKLRGDLSAYMKISSQLRAMRNEMYEADRSGKLKDQQALDFSFDVANLKRLSNKMRLLVCEQLRALINEIHHFLDSTSTSEQTSNCNDLEPKRNSRYSLELADKCTELLHSITITAIKEEIFEKERLLSNLRLRNGKSAVYIVLRSRWRVRPRSCHKDNDIMSAESKQQLLDMRGDDYDGVRVKLLELIECHETIGYVMDKVRAEQKKRAGHNSDAEQVEADHCLISCLRLTAKTTQPSDSLNPKDEALSHHGGVAEHGRSPDEVLQSVFAKAKRIGELFDELMVLYYDMQAQRDVMMSFVLVVLVVAVYMYTR